jgi:hypothetical protein
MHAWSGLPVARYEGCVSLTGRKGVALSAREYLEEFSLRLNSEFLNEQVLSDVIYRLRTLGS